MFSHHAPGYMFLKEWLYTLWQLIFKTSITIHANAA